MIAVADHAAVKHQPAYGGVVSLEDKRQAANPVLAAKTLPPGTEFSAAETGGQKSA
jgi:hypothetical protein